MMDREGKRGTDPELEDHLELNKSHLCNKFNDIFKII